jgi:hypothetical protein
MKWKGERLEEHEGLRVNIVAFWCEEQQRVAKSLWIGENLDSQESFDAAIDRAMLLRPNQGTCPGQAIEEVVLSIQNNDPITRPHKAAVLVTDGVMYDMPIPKMAAQGLEHFGTYRYSLGIAMPQSASYSFGLTPGEVTRQYHQLRHFVNNKFDNIFNFGSEGYDLLNVIAGRIAIQLQRDVFNSGEDKHVFWCGFTDKNRCVGTAPSLGNGRFCKWMDDDGKWPGGKLNACQDKGYCEWPTSFLCSQDSKHCFWDGTKCQTRAEFIHFRSSSFASNANMLPTLAPGSKGDRFTPNPTTDDEYEI